MHLSPPSPPLPLILGGRGGEKGRNVMTEEGWFGNMDTYGYNTHQLLVLVNGPSEP